MIRDWKNKIVLATVGMGVLMSTIFSGCGLAEEDISAQVTPLVATPSVTATPRPVITPSWEQRQDQEAVQVLAEAKAYLASIGSAWCPATYLQWLYYQGEEYQTDAFAAAYWLALKEPCRQPTALCCDGTYSYSQHRSGTCSWHDGVCEWY